MTLKFFPTLLMIAGVLVTTTTGVVAVARVEPVQPLVLYHTPGQSVYVMWGDGQPLTQMVDFEKLAAQTPVWSPVDNQAAFISGSYITLRTNIYMVDVLGHVQRLTTNPDAAPRHQSLVWSPDGLWLAYVYVAASGRFHVRLLSPDGSQSIAFLQEPDGGFWQIVYGSLRWSPDATLLSMVVLPEPNAPKYLVFLNIQTGQYAQFRLPFDWVSAPEWSPNGQWLAMAGYLLTSNNTAIYRLNVDNLSLERLVGGYEGNLAGSIQKALTWSPDSHTLLFAANRGYASSIFSVDIESREATRLSRGIVNDNSPVWSEDGQWIYFTSRRDQSRGIYRMRPDGTGVEKLVDTGNHEFYATITSVHTRPLNVFILLGLGMVAFGLSLWQRIRTTRR